MNGMVCEKEDVGGSGGANGAATIKKWKQMMSAKPDKGVKSVSKAKFKTKKKTSRGAKSRMGMRARERLFPVNHY